MVLVPIPRDTAERSRARPLPGVRPLGLRGGLRFGAVSGKWPPHRSLGIAPCEGVATCCSSWIMSRSG